MHADPYDFFTELYEGARTKVIGRDYNAMTLATVTAEGRPAARVVLLKGYDREGFVFYTNLQSRKGRELEARAYACLNFYWPELEHQIRIDGPVAQVPDEEADAYFATRPRGSQIGAWASRQSETLSSREALLAEVDALERRFDGKPVPRPPHWSGLRLSPVAIEFWKNEPSRLHRRWLYERAGPAAAWTVRLLYP